VWIKRHRHLKTEFLSGRVYICHILTTCCEVPLVQDLKIHLIYDILEIFIEYKERILIQITNNGFRGY